MIHYFLFCLVLSLALRFYFSVFFVHQHMKILSISLINHQSGRAFWAYIICSLSSTSKISKWNAEEFFFLQTFLFGWIRYLIRYRKHQSKRITSRHWPLGGAASSNLCMLYSTAIVRLCDKNFPLLATITVLSSQNFLRNMSNRDLNFLSNLIKILMAWDKVHISYY